jgi:ABC-2 type transport system permease protein
MIRHLRLYRAFWRNCLRQAVEFRANFWASLATNLGWLSSLALFLKLIYANTHAVAGWSEGQMFLLIGTYSVLHGITDTLFYQNLAELPNQIRLGTMDFILLRPVNSQFFVSLRYVALDGLGQLVGVVVLLGYGLWRLPAPPSPVHVAAYLFLLLCGVVLFYAISLLTMTLAFWLVRLDNLFVALDTVFGISRTPIGVFRAFGPGAQFFLTYILPLAFLAAVPVQALTQRLLTPALLAGPLLAAAFFALSVLFWRHATRSYSSASS